MPNYYYTSTGEKLSDGAINSRWRKEVKGMMVKYRCEACGKNETNDPDHTISRATCKTLHKTELIWDEKNVSWSCRYCHQQWESYKSGAFSYHRNVKQRMEYTLQYDKQGFLKRLDYIQDEQLKQQLNTLL